MENPLIVKLFKLSFLDIILQATIFYDKHGTHIISPFFCGSYRNINNFVVYRESLHILDGWGIYTGNSDVIRICDDVFDVIKVFYVGIGMCFPNMCDIVL